MLSDQPPVRRVEGGRRSDLTDRRWLARCWTEGRRGVMAGMRWGSRIVLVLCLLCTGPSGVHTYQMRTSKVLAVSRTPRLLRIPMRLVTKDKADTVIAEPIAITESPSQANKGRLFSLRSIHVNSLPAVPIGERIINRKKQIEAEKGALIDCLLC
jgi:hypothetical protein